MHCQLDCGPATCLLLKYELISDAVAANSCHEHSQHVHSKEVSAYFHDLTTCRAWQP